MMRESVNANFHDGSALGRRSQAPPAITAFISYSRRDMAFVDRLVPALESRGIRILIDRRDLPKLEDWQRELLHFIRIADTVIFVVSPHSIKSEVCDWEVEQVRAHAKRLAPIVISDLDGLSIPKEISKLNYIFFTDHQLFAERIDELTFALNTNIGWLKEHTRIGQLAWRWQEKNQSNSALLRGLELEDAEAWISIRPNQAPEPTTLHRNYLSASRHAEKQRQRLWVTGSLAIAVGAIALAAISYIQRDQALRSQSLFLAGLSHQETTRGDASTGTLLALEALPNSGAPWDRPLGQPRKQRNRNPFTCDHVTQVGGVPS